MAKIKKENRRCYGTGTVIERGNGLTIGWREAVVQPDGTVKRVMRWKALGPVSKREANETVQTLAETGRRPRPGSTIFRALATKWKTIVLPIWKYST
jgi:hypothetical protein